MRQYFLAVAIFTASVITLKVNAQTRIGFSESDIRYKEFPDKEFKSGSLKEGEKYNSCSTEKIICTYVFDSTNICSWCAIQPKNQGSLNYYVEEFNRIYVIIDDTHWKWYSDKGIIKITLSFPKEADGYNTFFFDRIK